METLLKPVMPKKTRNFRNVLVVFLTCVCAYASARSDNKGFSDDKNLPSLLGNSINAPALNRIADSIYNLIGLGSYGLQKEVFYSAYRGYQYLHNKGSLRKQNLLTICDYSQSSNNKRLYVIDLLESRLLFNTYVSHGRNSGQEYATSFSNLQNSNKSSLGFMVTGETYSGVAGYSLRLNGMEPGINDHVRSRDIVLHGSRFVNEDMVSERGLIGRSFGCPAVPLAIHKRIIDAIKGGSCLYIYSADDWYAHSSRILNSTFDLAPTATDVAGQVSTEATTKQAVSPTSDFNK
jgi:hypothetical protein